MRPSFFSALCSILAAESEIHGHTPHPHLLEVLRETSHERMSRHVFPEQSVWLQDALILIDLLRKPFSLLPSNAQTPLTFFFFCSSLPALELFALETEGPTSPILRRLQTHFPNYAVGGANLIAGHHLSHLTSIFFGAAQELMWPMEGIPSFADACAKAMSQHERHEISASLRGLPSGSFFFPGAEGELWGRRV